MEQDGTQTAFFAEIHGRVQGLGFRYSAQDEARRLRLCGWVRNTSYGTVEVSAQGPKDNIEKFLQWLRKGPPGARVDHVDYRVIQPDSNCDAFYIER